MFKFTDVIACHVYVPPVVAPVLSSFQACLTIYRVAQKSKPLPNKQKIVLKPISEIKFIRQIKVGYESSTIILFVCIRYSMRYLLSDPQN